MGGGPGHVLDICGIFYVFYYLASIYYNINFGCLENPPKGEGGASENG